MKKTGKKPSLTSVTLKSRSRSTILMHALPHALRNTHVKFDRNPPNSLLENGRTKVQAETDAPDPETSQTRTAAHFVGAN